MASLAMQSSGLTWDDFGHMSTVFTRIINREIPAQFVYEDDICVVLMDKFPSVAGQTLVISRREVDYLFDLTENEYHHLCAVARKVALASDKAFAAVRSCLVVEGFEVPHVHIKIYPMTETSKSLGQVITETSEMPDAELEAQAEKIKSALH